jgi:hypothetical protein
MASAIEFMESEESVRLLAFEGGTVEMDYTSALSFENNTTFIGIDFQRLIPAVQDLPGKNASHLNLSPLQDGRETRRLELIQLPQRLPRSFKLLQAWHELFFRDCILRSV